MEVKNLAKIINHQEIISDINFTLNRGEIVGLVGRNGTGKTTLFRTIANHYQEDSGEVIINGTSLKKECLNYEEIFYLDNQYNFLANLTVNRIASYYKKLYLGFDSEKFFGLIKKHRLPEQVVFKRLSKGMKGLLMIILAISSGANYLLLDEPFDGLDVLIKKQAIQLVLNEVSLNQRAILISSHNLVELEQLIDRVLFLKDQTITKEYHLEELRSEAVKLQLVFKENTLPKLVRDHAKVIEVQGRVIVGIFNHYSPELDKELRALRPIVMEKLPVLLEDLFRADLADEEIFIADDDFIRGNQV